MDVRRFFFNLRVSPSSVRLHNQMWLHRFDIMSLPVMSGRNNMRYNYYRICFGICMQIMMLWWQLCNRSLCVHEIKWTSHVKRASDVAQSYIPTSSVLTW